MNKHVLGAAAAVFLAAVLPVAAETPAPAAAPAKPKVEMPAGVFLKAQKPTDYLAKDRLIGAKVMNKDGVIIGDVEDLVVNSDHKIEGVVMGVGGFLGMGEKRVGVALSALQIDAKDGETVITLPQATKDVLTALEPFERVKPPKSMLEKAAEKVQELKDKSSATAKDATEKAKEKSGPAMEKAKEAAKNAAEKAKEAVKDAADKAGPALEKAKEAAKSAVEKAKEAVKTDTKPADSAPVQKQ